MKKKIIRVIKMKVNKLEKALKQEWVLSSQLLR